MDGICKLIIVKLNLI